MWGMSFDKPVRHVREYLSVLMPMLEGKPVVCVSSKTGKGIDELKGLLETTLPKLARRTQDGPFRIGHDAAPRQVRQTIACAAMTDCAPLPTPL